MSILTITPAEILRLCRLDPADTIHLADANEVLDRGQEAYEAMVQPVLLNDPGLAVFLRRNVAKLLAADLLGMRSREEGVSVGLQGAGITLGPPPDLAGRLRDEAMLLLEPYLRSWRPGGAITTPEASEAAQDAQSALFGPAVRTR
ncbi:MAG: hypothetical protein SFU56_05300 [Capsulimonadales bacterium]|nr:hypothetical protein [Capsulimonadales bacterium]